MTRLFSVVSVLSMLAFAAPTFAQTKCSCTCDPKDPACVPCDPKDCGGVGGGADCSPGFYKNHVEAWCPATETVSCPNDTSRTYTCDELVCLLSAEGGPGCTFKANRAQREFAKACLDALSPADICEE